MLRLTSLGICILITGLTLSWLSYEVSNGKGAVDAVSKFPSPTTTIDAELDNVPIYPGAKRLGPIPNQSRTIAFEARDSLSKVVSFYRDALPKKGWFLNSVLSSFSFDYVW